jgi:hypothetical protein
VRDEPATRKETQMAMKSTKKSDARLKVKKEKIKDLTVKETNKVLGGAQRAGEPCCTCDSDILSPFTK